MMIGLWPWALTPLTARVVGALFALEGVSGLCLALDPRWTSARITLESQFVSMLFILIAIARTWSTIDRANPLSWVFMLSIVAILVTVAIIFIYVKQTRPKPT